MMTLGVLRGLIAVLTLAIKQRESLALASPADHAVERSKQDSNLLMRSGLRTVILQRLFHRMDEGGLQ